MRPENEIGKSRLLEKVGLALSICLLFYLGIKSLSVAITDVFSFDGAMNAQVAQNLARGIGYATSYPYVILFDGKVQTGPTVLLPVSLFFKIFGETFFSGLLVNALYMFFTFISVFILLKYCLNVESILVFLSLLSIMLIPKIFKLGFGLYGEIPALFFFLIYVILTCEYLKTKSDLIAFSAGIAIGLSVLTKTVLLIAAPSLGIFWGALFIDKLHSYQYNESVRKSSLIVPIGLTLGGGTLPLLSFEAVKLIQLGLPTYLNRSKNLIKEIFKQAGLSSGYADTLGLFDKFSKHLSFYFDFTGLTSSGLLILLIVITVTLILLLHFIITRYNNLHRQELISAICATIILLVTLLYFLWWLVITPTEKAWYRRIINGGILLQICLPIFITYFVQLLMRTHSIPNKISRTSKPILVIVLFGLIISGFLTKQTHRDLLITFENTPEKIAVNKLASLIKSLPPQSKIYGFGWMQAPVVAFASGRNFYDLYRDPEIFTPGVKKNSYLVADETTYLIAKNFLNEALSHFVFEEVYHDGSYGIYELKEKKLFDYEPFTLEEKFQRNPSSINFAIEDIQNPTRNIYLQEKNPYGKWAQNISAILLGYNGESLLKIKYSIPDISKYARNFINIKIYVNRRLLHTQTVFISGNHEINIRLDNINNDQPLYRNIEISIICDNFLIIEEDRRNLSLFLTEISLIKE